MYRKDFYIRNKRTKLQHHHYPIWIEKDLQRFLQILEELPDRGDDITHKVMARLALASGARATEIRALTWSDVDWKNHVIHINKPQESVSNKNMEISSVKLQESVRDVHVDECVMELLAKHKAIQGRYLKSNGYKNPHGYIFGKVGLENDELIPAIYSDFSEWLNQLCKKHDLPHITAHFLRHIAIIRVLDRGTPLKEMQNMLGLAKQ